MTIPIIHSMMVNNGQTLVMPPWEAGQTKWGDLAIPEVYVAGTERLYPTGTIFRKGIRTFVYTKYVAGITVVGAGYCLESTAEVKDVTNGVISGAAGASTLIVDMGGSIAENAYAGGFIGIKMGTGGGTTAGRYSTYQIISNTVSDANDRVTFTIDGALVLALTTADDVIITENPYAEVRTTLNLYGMTVGINLQTTEASLYCWLQTGGPNNMLSQLIALEGDTVNSIAVYNVAGVPQVVAGGAAGASTLGGIEVAMLQRIGYVYASTDIGGPGGSPADITVSPPVWLSIFN
ncbi:hypothetical protein LCGC14_2148640 [marine sediment metagenome]|uniref:Ubiquitin-activating enzyme E1 FCCH domain-containing protein n=1 Tax=marine sediment metagenome TaxID=412755 RepID=A0A0F9G970_9ZZZZ